MTLKNDNTNEQKKAKILFVLSFLLLWSSIYIYFNIGFGYQFPTKQVLLAIIPTTINVIICYIIGRYDYVNLGHCSDTFGILGNIIFNMVVFTGTFLLFSKV